ncbi:MAG: polysaccharide biosynthesis protein [Phycisphaerae bacterium]|nr:polysaccharide biosynthesis protein [Phycisphaerae bacterium]
MSTAPSNHSAATLPPLMVKYRMTLVVTAHAALFAAALLAAFLLAYNFRWTFNIYSVPHPWFTPMFLPLLAIALPIKLMVFWWMRQYQGTWRYVGLRDLYGVISASFISSFLLILAYLGVENLYDHFFGRLLIDHPRDVALRESSVFLSDWAATIVFVSAARVLVRFYYEDVQPVRGGEPRKRVLIVGAGDAGEALVRELRRMRPAGYECVGFLDDDVVRLHGRIHDVEVLGRTSMLGEICRAKQIDEVMIAEPEAGPRRMRGLVEQCEGIGVRFRTIPAVSEVITGRVQISQIRDVEITDLLGREPVQLDIERIGEILHDRVTLVTGAGGSIGSELCRQIAAFEPARLVLVEQAENNLFEIDRELRGAFPNLTIVPCVADITDERRVRSIFLRERPAAVFHAAAHKHVPMMELNVGEAIKNNIRGTMTVANAAVEAGVEKMVMISTDKAVNPTSIMGCSKRVAELYVQGLNARRATQFVTVRFGNVLGSSGSVVPIFREQIRAGGPVTVTHPDMVRFFMTIPEAAQLVLQAGTMGNGGEIYVLHMGDPVRIVDLARDMITLSGLRPGTDIEIVFAGRRPGEKLYEELSNVGEHIGDTAHPKIGIWKHRREDHEAVQRGIERLLSLADGSDEEAIRGTFKELVPEFQPDAEERRSHEATKPRSHEGTKVKIRRGASGEAPYGLSPE